MGRADKQAEEGSAVSNGKNGRLVTVRPVGKSGRIGGEAYTFELPDGTVEAGVMLRTRWRLVQFFDVEQVRELADALHDAADRAEAGDFDGGYWQEGPR